MQFGRTGVRGRRDGRVHEEGPRVAQLAAVLAAMWMGGGLTAQRDPAATPQLPVVTIQNLSATPRSEWWCVSVPFAKGQLRGDRPSWMVESARTVWQPFGARWPDGSLRQALCFFRAEVPGLGERRLKLVPVASKDPAPAVFTPLFGPAPAAGFEFVCRRGGQTFRAKPESVRVLEHNAARKVEVWRGRLGTSGLVGELTTERYAEQEHVYVSVAVFHSDPAQSEMDCKVDEAWIETRGLLLVLRHGAPVGVVHDLRADGSRVSLLRDASLGDAQGIRRVGVLSPPLSGKSLDRLRDQTLVAAANSRPLGATSWRESGAFGPFGFVPEVPPWFGSDEGVRSAMAARHQWFFGRDRSDAHADPFRDAVHGLARYAGRTGDQADFGVVKLEPVAATGMPSFLFEVEASVLQEACRPVHFYETDTSPVDPARHPGWVVWSGRTHWHCGVSKDRLGKPCPEPPSQTHRWTGKDRQHWSSNYLAAYYLLTGSPFARLEIENEIRLYLAGQTLEPEKTTSHSGAPRGAGRTLQAASWLWLCTGDEALMRRMNERVDRIHWGEWVAKDLPEDRVTPLQVANPDPRMLEGKCRYWTPWQDALAVIGFEAFARISANTRARELSRRIARNCLLHGWRLEGQGAPILATAIRWRDDGSPPEQLDTAGAEDVLWSFGTAFSVWALPAVEVARQDAVAAGDAALAERAAAIQAALRARRARPRDGWFDAFGQWDALR